MSNSCCGCLPAGASAGARVGKADAWQVLSDGAWLCEGSDDLHGTAAALTYADYFDFSGKQKPRSH